MAEQHSNIKKLALIFFILIGGSHILSGLMTSNGYFLPLSNDINKVLDIPFAMTALLYGFTSIEIRKDNPQKKVYYVIMAGISVLLFLSLIYINLILPDQIN